MTLVRLVRHGRASAGWDTHLDPPLDELGQLQAAQMAADLGPLGPLHLVTSPLCRCRETAAVLAAQWGVDPVIDDAVAEIPSPEGVAMERRTQWLRNAMGGTWTDLGPRYTQYRDGVVAAVAALGVDTVVTTHFVAINAVIGAATVDDRVLIRSLDNCSVTVVEVGVGGRLTLLEGGREADTLIR